MLDAGHSGPGSVGEFPPREDEVVLGAWSAVAVLFHPVEMLGVAGVLREVDLELVDIFTREIDIGTDFETLHTLC
jgi:hypothetical protein